MAERDRAAVDVHLVHVEAEILGDGAGLGGEGLVRFDQVDIVDAPAGLFQRLAARRDRAGAHQRRIDAGRRPRHDARQRLYAAFLGLLARHQDERRGAIIDAGSVARRYRAVSRKGRTQLGEGFRGGAVARILVGIDRDVALAARDDHRDDLVGEPAGFLRRFGLGLAGGGERVLVVARDLPLLGDILCRGAHMVAVEGVPQAVLDHRVGEGDVAHLGAGPHLGGVRRLAHALLAAGYDDLGIAGLDRLAGHRDGAQARAANLVDGQRRLFLRHAGGHRGLPGRVLAGIGGQHLAHDHVVDVRAGDVRAFHRRRDGDSAEIGGRHLGEGAAEGADRGAGGTCDDDIGHGCFLLEIRPRIAGGNRFAGARRACGLGSTLYRECLTVPDLPQIAGVVQSIMLQCSIFKCTCEIEHYRRSHSECSPTATRPRIAAMPAAGARSHALRGGRPSCRYGRPGRCGFRLAAGGGPGPMPIPAVRSGPCPE